MKTIMFGVCSLGITVLMIVALLQVVNIDTHEVSLRDTVYSAMEASLETALDTRAYTIDDEDELVADVVQGVALELSDPRTSLTVQVNKVDRTLGIISMKLTASTPALSGKPSVVMVERTVVLEHVDNAPLPGTRTVTFQNVAGENLKTYVLTENSQKMPYPNHPVGAGLTFLGWEHGGVLYTNDEAGRAAMRELPLDQDYLFIAQVG